MLLSDQTHEALTKLKFHISQEMKRWITGHCEHLKYPNDYRSLTRKEIVIVNGKIYALPSNQTDFDTMQKMFDEIEKIVGSTVFS